jgi:hypothetical protein
MTFVSCFHKLQYFAELRSIPRYGLDSSEILGITRNEQFIQGNNKNLSESIPRNFFGTKLRWQPYLSIINQSFRMLLDLPLLRI